MKKTTGLLGDLSKSGFVRSVITRVLAILIVVSIIIAAVTISSFTSEVRRSVLAERQRQLAAVEQTISERMAAMMSIAFNIGNDPVFYLEPIEHDPTSGLEMSKMLKRYLVGNGFIEHLAFCRAAEPDTIYTSKGERSLSEFFISGFAMDQATVERTIQGIHEANDVGIRVVGSGDNAYFTYAYPLPQLAAKPQAHVLMMIPVKRVRPLLETMLINGSGEAAVFDANGVELYRVGDLGDELPLAEYVKSSVSEENYSSAPGSDYVLQKIVSASNGWTYVSAIRHSDTLSGLANRQLMFILFILLVLVAAVVVMLCTVIRQYKPIARLAAQVAGAQSSGDADRVVDERTLLSKAITTLKDDSEQKQKYESAYYEAEAANKAKTAFLSSMSHDIRTPMNAIIGMTSLALKHRDEPEYVAECLQKVQLSSNYLLDIINNVLDMSRIEAGRIPIAKEPLLIPALVDSTVSLVSASAEAKGQTLETELADLRQTAVLGDSVHIVQVFVNILSNAVKFTPEGGKLTLRVWQVECSDAGYGRYIFTFTDTGIGMPPEFIDHVFDTFSRADEPIALHTEGTGLGMAIAKKLVELMDGTICCTSELGSGTTFTVTLHMKLADAEQAASLTSLQNRKGASSGGEEEPPLDLTGMRVLLAEDNAMNREIAHKLIGETGAEVVEVQDGRQAAEAFSAHPAGYFNLIFMDIQMPVMNGYAATAAIRAMDRTDAATVPIVAMTANTFDEDVRRVKEAGMNGHIGKPYNPATLHQMLARMLCPRQDEGKVN